MSHLVSAKSVSIEFAFGSAVIQAVSYSTLTQIFRDVVNSENLYVTIEGHTDNIGGDQSNLTLSQQRAVP